MPQPTLLLVGRVQQQMKAQWKLTGSRPPRGSSASAPGQYLTVTVRSEFAMIDQLLLLSCEEGACKQTMLHPLKHSAASNERSHAVCESRPACTCPRKCNCKCNHAAKQ